MQLQSTLLTWHPVTPWNEMKDVFASAPNNHQESFLPPPPSLMGWAIPAFLDMTQSTKSEMISPVLFAADAKQWFMSTAVIWQAAQRFTPTDNVYANWRDVSLHLQSCTHQDGQWHIVKEISLILGFCTRIGVLTQTLLSQSSPRAWYSNYSNTYNYLFPPAKLAISLWWSDAEQNSSGLYPYRVNHR